MRIKRFIASDMRTALRMVRDEQGPDAVILSNRPCEEGVEVVSATDYDEALVHQALRAAAPALASARTTTVATAATPSPAAASTPAPGPVVLPTAPPAPPSVRETLANRARAVFKLGDAQVQTPVGPVAEPTLAELTAGAAATAATATPPTRFESMMAALGAPQSTGPSDNRVSLSTSASATPSTLSPPALSRPTEADGTCVAVAAAAQVPVTAETMPSDATPISESTAAERTIPQPRLELSLEPLPLREARIAARECANADADADTDLNLHAAPQLHAIPRWDADPAVAAMREELASMRQIIEREMGQFAVERLRGSPARAAAFDILLGYGCDEALAQTIAARLDPSMDPAKVRAPMLAELARMLTVNRCEPIDDGGVIALIGPTGAGKTTTAAKLAARYAARHRARDVALVTTDAERVGAREQLHAHGRRIGVTVCEAHGPEALAKTLEQLQDYPLVLVDNAGFGARDRALLGQLTWLRATRNVRSLLVLPANAHPHDMNEVVRRYRMATPEGVVLTKLDETGRLGAALSMLIRNGLSLAYTAEGQQVSTDLNQADPSHLVLLLEKLRRAADNPLATEDRHAVVC